MPLFTLALIPDHVRRRDSLDDVSSGQAMFIYVLIMCVHVFQYHFLLIKCMYVLISLSLEFIYRGQHILVSTLILVSLQSAL